MVEVVGVVAQNTCFQAILNLARRLFVNLTCTVELGRWPEGIKDVLTTVWPRGEGVLCRSFGLTSDAGLHPCSW